MNLIDDEKILKFNYHNLYQRFWQPQVSRMNIPSRPFDIQCECHKNLNHFIVKELTNETMGFSTFDICHNKPCFDLEHLLSIKPHNDQERISWMINLLTQLYEISVCGYPCYEDAQVIHYIFWNFDTKERDQIIAYLSTSPSIVSYVENDILDTFNWLCDDQHANSWITFTTFMCSIYQLSFVIYL